MLPYLCYKPCGKCDRFEGEGFITTQETELGGSSATDPIYTHNECFFLNVSFQFMQDASDVMQLLLKTQTDFSDMEDDDPQVKQPRLLSFRPSGLADSLGLNGLQKEMEEFVS